MEFNATTVPVKLVGTKLGKSTGLAVDHRYGVYYFLPRDYACMRWDSREPMLAENHDVILQSADLLPNVQQIFIDKQRQLWALLESKSQSGFYCANLGNSNFIFML